MRINNGIESDTPFEAPFITSIETAYSRRRLLCYHPFLIKSAATAPMKVVLPKSAAKQASPWKYAMKSPPQKLSEATSTVDVPRKPPPLSNASPNTRPVETVETRPLNPEKVAPQSNHIPVIETVSTGVENDDAQKIATADSFPINLSTAVDLDISIADTDVTGASTATVVRFTTIIEAAMANFRQYDKNSSKLSKVWLACDENQQISMQDALEAAVTDMMNLQSQLVTAERKIDDHESTPASSVTSNEEALLAQIAELQRELAASRDSVDQHAHCKQRMIANLKKKKAQVETSEHDLSVATMDLKHVSSENATLRQALQAATEARDSFKNKLRSQQESVKESRAWIQDLEKRLRKTEQARALEVELLDNFRKLAIHTGYYKWGKPIRALEDKIAAFAAEEAASGAEYSI